MSNPLIIYDAVGPLTSIKQTRESYNSAPICSLTIGTLEVQISRDACVKVSNLLYRAPVKLRIRISLEQP